MSKLILFLFFCSKIIKSNIIYKVIGLMNFVTIQKAKTRKILELLGLIIEKEPFLKKGKKKERKRKGTKESAWRMFQS